MQRKKWKMQLDQTSLPPNHVKILEFALCLIQYAGSGTVWDKVETGKSASLNIQK